MSWLYKESNIVVNEVPEAAVGFVYMITHIPSGKYYIGKKQLVSNRTLPPLKGTKRKRKVTKESDWRTYYSSNLWIKQQVKEGKAEEFKREIIRFCNCKKGLSYYEMYWQFKYDVLSDENSLNGNINGKFYTKDLEQ